VGIRHWRATKDAGADSCAARWTCGALLEVREDALVVKTVFALQRRGVASGVASGPQGLRA